MATNLNGCFHCLELAHRTRADFIFISTSRVHPFTALNDLPFHEQQTRFIFDPAVAVTGVSILDINDEFRLEGPRPLCGMTKLAADLLVEEFADAYGFRYVIDRFGLFTGPHQMAKSDQGVIALWMAAHFYRRNLSYIGFGGAGKQVRDFVHVDDCCDSIVDPVQNMDLLQRPTLQRGRRCFKQSLAGGDDGTVPRNSRTEDRDRFRAGEPERRRPHLCHRFSSCILHQRLVSALRCTKNAH